MCDGVYKNKKGHSVTLKLFKWKLAQAIHCEDELSNRTGMTFVTVLFLEGIKSCTLGIKQVPPLLVGWLTWFGEFTASSITVGYWPSFEILEIRVQMVIRSAVHSCWLLFLGIRGHI